MKRLFCLALPLAAAFGLQGCANDIAPSAAGPAPAPYVYKLGPDDRLKITVYGEESLTGDYAVDAEGNVVLPLAGPVKAAGQTIGEFSAALTQLLGAKYLNNPRVTVNLLGNRPVYILGEVNRAGQYNYRSDMTVLGAVATAGGFTYRANLKEVMIRHSGEAAEQRLPLRADQPVFPGDTIRVRERYF